MQLVVVMSNNYHTLISETNQKLNQVAYFDAVNDSLFGMIVV